MQDDVWPERLCPVDTRAGKYPVVRIPVFAALFPEPEISRYTLIQGGRFAGCLGLAGANLALNRPLDVNGQVRKIYIEPLESEQFTAS